MANRSNPENRSEAEDRSGTATVTRDAAESGGGSGQTPRGLGGRGDGRSGGRGPSKSKSSFFDVYKPGQGYYTRLGTAIGGGILILGFGDFLIKRLSVYQDATASWTMWLRYGLPAILVVMLGLVLYWVVGVNRAACDFFIATEGEMKKVSWSDRNELVGSTKVVIVFTFMLGLLLAVVDLAFIQFFQFINVLRSGQG